MKIAYVVPAPMNVDEMKRRKKMLKEWAFEGTDVEIICSKEGPASVESMYEEYLSIPETAKEISRLEQKGYDAAIIGCAGDPGLDAMREITTKMLVLGPGQTSIALAAMLGHKFTVLTVDEGRIPSKYELAYKAGVLSKLGTVRAVNVPVLEIQKDREKAIKIVFETAKKALAEDGADCIVLGCMSMGFLNVAEELSEKLGIPVINPSKTVLKLAEALVSSQLIHSKRAFSTPPKLATGKVKSLNELYIK